MKRRWWSAGILVIAGLLGVAAMLACFSCHNGIRVTIKNLSPRPIRSVVLPVTGVSYPLGDISARSSAEAMVKAQGESHLEIEFVDATGKTVRLNAGGYFEPHYHGAIQVSIKDGKIEKNEQHVKLGLW
jgi:hypothetical protein